MEECGYGQERPFIIEIEGYPFIVTTTLGIVEHQGKTTGYYVDIDTGHIKILFQVDAEKIMATASAAIRACRAKLRERTLDPLAVCRA